MMGNGHNSLVNDGKAELLLYVVVQHRPELAVLVVLCDQVDDVGQGVKHQVVTQLAARLAHQDVEQGVQQVLHTTECNICKKM